MKWIVGVSIIAIAMGWVATATIPAATITPDEATLRLLPAETRGVGFIDVASLLNAPLVKDVWNTYRPTFESTEFFKVTGLVPERDTDTVTIARIGQEQLLAIVQARYDKFKAEQFFRDKGKEPEVHLGRAVYAANNFAFSFLDSMIIAGHPEQVKKAIDQISLPGSVSLRADLMDSIRTIEAGSQVWGVGDFSSADLPSDLRERVPVVEVLKKLRSGTYEMRIGHDIHVKTVANFEDTETARNLSDTARGMIALIKLQVAQQQPDMVRVLDGVQVSNSGASIVVNVDQSGELLKKLKDLRFPLRKVE